MCVHDHVDRDLGANPIEQMYPKKTSVVLILLMVHSFNLDQNITVEKSQLKLKTLLLRQSFFYRIASWFEICCMHIPCRHIINHFHSDFEAIEVVSILKRFLLSVITSTSTNECHKIGISKSKDCGILFPLSLVWRMMVYIDILLLNTL